MSIHRSLGERNKRGKGHRNVLKRFERLLFLKEGSRWSEEKDSVFGLPKVKSIKLKRKKG